MKVYALLSWFDESPEHLRRCVRSLKGFADVLVAVDGPYATFEHTEPLSPVSNWRAITEACCEAGLRFSPHHPYLPAWDSEVAKRAAMFQFGRWAGATPDDWFLIIDADMELAEDTHRRYARDRLAATSLDVAEVRWHDVMINGVKSSTYRFRSLFRALSGLTVERAHFLYTVPPWVNQPRRFLWHEPSGHISHEPTLDLFGSVALHHYNSQRDPERKQRALDYYKDRDARGLEVVGRDWTGLGELA